MGRKKSHAKEKKQNNTPVVKPAPAPVFDNRQPTTHEIINALRNFATEQIDEDDTMDPAAKMKKCVPTLKQLVKVYHLCEDIAPALADYVKKETGKDYAITDFKAARRRSRALEEAAEHLVNNGLCDNCSSTTFPSCRFPMSRFTEHYLPPETPPESPLPDLNPINFGFNRAHIKFSFSMPTTEPILFGSSSVPNLQEIMNFPSCECKHHES